MKPLPLSDYIACFSKQNILIKADLDTCQTPVEFISYDSRNVKPGTLFVCKGAHFKEEYGQFALKNGAIALVTEKSLGDPSKEILVSDIRKAISLIADTFYGGVQKDIFAIGLTGTKGKSTTAQYIRDCLNLYLESQGKKDCAIVSSIDTYDGVRNFRSHITTPEPFELFKAVNNAVQSGLSHVIMEVSSQALKYGRVAGLHYKIAAFTNIGVDHISPVEHSSFEDYFASKCKIFDMCDVAVINADSEHFQEIFEYAKPRCQVITYGSSGNATIHCEKVETRRDGTFFQVAGPDFCEEMSITMPGIFNVSNALCAIAVLRQLQVPVTFIKEGLRHATVDGRMELYSSSNGNVKVIVDYAHNKLSFDTLYESVRKEYADRKIITVFGCPGDKAILRRKDMGSSANANSDYIYVTEDDPGEEGFEKIAKEIEVHIPDCPYEKVQDRGEAIRKAVTEHGDEKTIVLILGKGQEKTQKRGTGLEAYASNAENAKIALGLYNKLHKE
ncbi:MAG: UDP-N-acetylmuramoyl-L-alanyl-D-glutamate--2,6-diaminopimelate ligase [Clostridia bacterium]|nr:UDP-N-acetylmuramoyl-L-alanyl-D-glutamate--2,6-diaminopimelate ligase [Clostridia bacterium]